MLCFYMRVWQVDFLRGVAVVLMILFHAFFDLTEFGKLQIEIYSGFWFFFARFVAAGFLVLVGVSLQLRFVRVKEFKVYLKRGAELLGLGLLISVFTFVFFRESLVLFGILHCIGVSVVLAFPLLKRRVISLWLGLGVIGVGVFFYSVSVKFNWLLWLGLRSAEMSSLDYYPLLPWFGFVLVGVFLAEYIPRGGSPGMFGMFCKVGRKSLLIYFLHQPVLLVLFYGLGLIG